MIHSIKDPDRFSKIMGGIQSGIVSVAVLVGGAWTLYAFNAQLQVENANAQLAKIKREISAEPKVEVSIQLDQLALKSASQNILTGTVTFKNVGTQDIAIVLRDTPIGVFEVTFDATGIEHWRILRELPLRQSDKTIYGAIALHAGSQVARSFSTPMPQAGGLLAVKISAARSSSEVERLRFMGAPDADIANRAEWGGHAYIAVECMSPACDQRRRQSSVP